MKRILALWLAAALFAAQPCYAVVMVGFGQVAAPSGYSDSFTNANDTLLATHDANWVNASGTQVVSNLEIIGNSVTTVGAYSVAGAIHNASTSDVSQITFKGLTNTAQTVPKYVSVRADGTSLGYNAGMISLSAGNWTAIAIRENTTQMGTGCTGLSIAAGSDHVLRIEAVGTSTVTVTVYVDGTEMCQRVDSATTITTGHPGFYISGNGTIGNNAFDDWQDHE